MFTHLHTHSYYSFLDGVLSPEELVNLAHHHGMASLALTDHNGLTGAIQFYDVCHKSGIKPILGLEVTIHHPFGRGNIVVLAKDMTGWASLCQLSSIIHTSDEGKQEDGIPFDQLVECSNGLICLSGGKRDLIHQLITHNQDIDAFSYLEQLKEVFDGDLFSEIQYQNPGDAPVIQRLSKLSKKMNISLVATNNVHYNTREQVFLQRTLSAMRVNTPLSNLDPGIPAPAGSFFASSDEMRKRFVEIPDAIENTSLVAERCNLILPVGKIQYPELQFLSGESPRELLQKFVEIGVKQRYGKQTPDTKKRLDYEIKMIHERGYTPLFLIVKDILDYARKENIPFSSRGSAASSLVAYCLGITSPDPIALNLYFERFLNPARTTPPDIDTDLCSKNRDRVIRYVYKKYGDDRVAMIATINRFQQRSAFREVAKAHGLSNKEIATLSEELSFRRWGPPTRSRGNADDPFYTFRSKYTSPKYQTIFSEAAAILEFPRHLSIHPGGIIISPDTLTNLIPTHLASKGIIITQFDLESIERLGLVKIDLLGTRGLTVLGDVSQQIQKWRSAEYKNRLEVLESIPEDDPETQATLLSTQTIGCFSIESPGMRTTLREINAKSVEDIMIALALYRPGPMTGGLKDSFIKRHLGREQVVHIHPSLSQILENTYGVILYQEQVLRIASELAGLSLADSDLLRRAMSHFDPGEQMKTLKTRFINGAFDISGISKVVGERIWDLMAAFAGYGFPKAHAASYAQLAWRSVWCKTHYPAEFMAAVLAGWGGYYRQYVYINETRRLKLKISPPHINHSKMRFSVSYPDGNPRLFMGLDQVRALSQETMRRILVKRKFNSLSDFLTRVDPRPKEVENLIMVGALDGLGKIPELLSRVKAGGWQYAQPRLFDLPLDNETDEDWGVETRVAAQQEILGIGIDAHPVELVRKKLNVTDFVSTTQAKRMVGNNMRLIGIRQTIQRYHTSDGDPYYILELDDSEDILPVCISTELYSRDRRIISSQQPFLVEGNIVTEQLTDMVMMSAKNLQPIKFNRKT